METTLLMNDRMQARETVAKKMEALENDVRARSLVALVLKNGGTAEDAAHLASRALVRTGASSILPLHILRRAEAIVKKNKNEGESKMKKGAGQSMLVDYLETLGVDTKYEAEVYSYFRRERPALAWQVEPSLRAVAIALLNRILVRENVTHRELTRVLERAVGKQFGTSGTKRERQLAGSELENDDEGTPGYSVVHNIVHREGEEGLRDRLASQPSPLSPEVMATGVLQAESFLGEDRVATAERVHRRTAYLKDSSSRALIAELLEQGHALASINVALKTYLNIDAPLGVGSGLKTQFGSIEAAVADLRKSVSDEEKESARIQAEEWMSGKEQRETDRFARHGELLRRGTRAQERMKNQEYSRLMSIIQQRANVRPAGIQLEFMDGMVGIHADGTYNLQGMVQIKLVLSDIEDGEERLKAREVARRLEADIEDCCAGYYKNGLADAMRSAAPPIVRCNFIYAVAYNKEPETFSCILK